MKLKKLPAQAIPAERPDVPSAPDHRPMFDTILACAAGGATIGSIWGMPGLFVGGAIGGGFGLYYRRHWDD
jgi:hypothetical protein